MTATRNLPSLCPVVAIGFWMDGERLRHEPDLHVGPHAVGPVGVEDPVHDRPVVDRVPLRILGIGVGASPFQRGRAIAAGEQVVRAEIDLIVPQLPQFRDQLPPVLPIGIVRLIRPKKPPYRLHGPDRFIGLNGYRDRQGGIFLLLCRHGTCRIRPTTESSAQRQPQRRRQQLTACRCR